jgi:hypothetical protein
MFTTGSGGPGDPVMAVGGLAAAAAELEDQPFQVIEQFA